MSEMCSQRTTEILKIKFEKLTMKDDDGDQPPATHGARATSRSPAIPDQVLENEGEEADGGDQPPATHGARAKSAGGRPRVDYKKMLKYAMNELGIYGEPPRFEASSKKKGEFVCKTDVNFAISEPKQTNPEGYQSLPEALRIRSMIDSLKEMESGWKKFFRSCQNFQCNGIPVPCSVEGKGEKKTNAEEDAARLVLVAMGLGEWAEEQIELKYGR